MLTNLQITIGALPILPAEKGHANEEKEEGEEPKKQKTHFKTKILEDGTYQTVEIEDEEE